MRKSLQNKVTELAKYIELLLAFFLSIVLFLFTCVLLVQLSHELMTKGPTWSVFQDFLAQAMTLAVGVELVKMLSKPSANTVIEVLLFAIARQLIIEHTSVSNFLIGIIAVALLFAVRKYLFVQFEAADHIIMRASQSVKLTNLLAKVAIPATSGQTLGEFVTTGLIEAEKTIAIGACVYLDGVALRVDSMKEGRITRVEIIKSL